MHEGLFAEIDRDDCHQLLLSHEVGRVAWASPTRGPVVLPVNYVLRGDTVIFRISPDSLLQELSQGLPVAFEIDDIDVTTRTGWSVLVSGRTRTPTSAELDALQASGLPAPWAGGTRTVVIALDIVDLTGRIVERSEP